jgi:ATP-dependent RNA helicase DDX21
VQPATPPPDPNNVSNFCLCAPIKHLLAEKGISSLFDIQAACIPAALEGKDIVGRARTGCGKTFAFVLPIVEILIREEVKLMPGGPNVICLLPTRELANQVRTRRGLAVWIRPDFLPSWYFQADAGLVPWARCRKKA